MSINLRESEFYRELKVEFRAAEEAGKIIDDFAEKGFQTENKMMAAKSLRPTQRLRKKL